MFDRATTPRRRRVGRQGPPARVASPGGAGLAYLGMVGQAEDLESFTFGLDRDLYFDPAPLPMTVTRAVPAGGSVILATAGLNWGSGVIVQASDSKDNFYTGMAAAVFALDVSRPFDDGTLLYILQGEITTALEPGDTITPQWRVASSNNGLPDQVAAYAFGYLGLGYGFFAEGTYHAYSASWPVGGLPAFGPDPDVCTIDGSFGEHTVGPPGALPANYASFIPFPGPGSPVDPVGARMFFSMVGINADFFGNTPIPGFDHWKTDGYTTLHSVFANQGPFAPDFDLEHSDHIVMGHRMVTSDVANHDPGGCWQEEDPPQVGFYKGLCAQTFTANGAPGEVSFGSPARGVVDDRRPSVGRLRPQTQTPV